jgi:cytochrome c551/c552
VVFGITALIMLLCTVWMLANDHNREWKQVQRQFRNVEGYTTAARVSEQESASYYARERELEERLAEARGAVPPKDAVDEFTAEAGGELHNGYDVNRVEDDYRKLAEAARGDDNEERIDRRDDLISAMQAIVNRAKQVEDNRQRDLKFKRAELDGVRSKYDISVNEGVAESRLEEIERNEVRPVDEEVRRLTPLAQNAKDHRVRLAKLLDLVLADEVAARKALADHQGNVTRLEKTLAERSDSWQKRVLELPILDAFGRPLKIDNIWLPQLTWNNNFRDVARFDRCTTCHQGIESTAPGSAIEPGYEPTRHVELKLATPSEPPVIDDVQEQHLAEMRAAADDAWAWNRGEARKAIDEQELQYRLVNAYGLQLGREGAFSAKDVTVTVVRPETAAAAALLQPGDVIELINDVKLLDRTRAITYLLDNVDWGRPLTLGVRRGIPQPFSSHPRLDLFVGSLSPHKAGDMGCTICHDGQGSATEFKFASHTPNMPGQMEDWHREHGWFNNHNWLFPMTPKRFNESLCLKCHHDVVELEPSDRFPDPPAPKLLAGYNIIRQYGCFGCHEINGWDGPNRRRGPDLRAEPTYFAAAGQLLIDPGLTDRERELAHEVIDHPEQHESRLLLAELIKADAALVPSADKKQPQTTEKMGTEVAETKAADAAGEATEPVPDRARLTPESHKLATILGTNEETPGQYRKVGPSLRHIAKKADFDFLYNWIKNPTDFRPTTKMPRFFGQWDHLVPVQKMEDGRPKFDRQGHPVMVESPGKKDAERFEPVEIRAIAEYLLDRSEPFKYLDFDEAATEEPSADRGKQVFETRGCLACHQHKEFPEARQSQGPDLSRIGSKLKGLGEDGERWLYSWVREPNRYHARTVMPNVFLEPITAADETVTDPARDVAAYLLGSQTNDWSPEPAPGLNGKALDDLAAIYLGASFSELQINGPNGDDGILKRGISADLAGDIKGDERMLLRGGPNGEAKSWSEESYQQQKLLYVGRRSISRLGCTGCHDIPGFEDAKPIGTGLADWGRKDTSKLAFEMIVEYLRERPPTRPERTDGDSHSHAGDESDDHSHADADSDHSGHANHEASHEHGLDPADMEPDTGFFVEALLHHQREGFMWQKLREPRSYDFKKTENKSYIDRLRMPKFNFDQEQIEQVMTFVLGLVAEPPASKYVYHNSPRRKAVVEGEQLLVKYNCIGCHTLKMETWEFNYDPQSPDFATAPKFDDYDFLLPHFTPEQLAASKKTDRRGLGRAVVSGMPNPEEQEDDDGNPFYYFTLYDSLPINGHPWVVGGKEVPVLAKNIRAKHDYFGGEFARYVYPVALDAGREENPNVKPSDVWGWVPPPLVREGQKVQTGWLHDFLLNPYRIRPAVVLRMPRFNMSSEEAEKLVHYFAAVDNADYPYQYHRSGDADYLPERQVEQLEQALNVITDNNYCVKCHLVGDFRPKGAASALAPNLDRVYQRLRPSYALEWIANPKRKLPYTGMPVNFPPHVDPNEKLRQQLFPGETEDALRGVVNLLMNFDAYMKQRTSIKSMVKEPPPPEPGAEQSASARK